MLSAIASHIPLSSAGKKTLVTPSSVNPGILKRSLAQKTGRLANLAVTSLLSYVVEQALSAGEKRKFLSGERQFWMMMRILRLLKPELRYFQDSVEFHGISTLMILTLQELRLNGSGQESLQALPNTRKREDIVRVLNEYQRVKEVEGFFDYADALLLCVSRPKRAVATYFINHHLTAAERRFVELSGMDIIDVFSLEHTCSYALSAYKVDTPYQEALQTIRNVADDLLQNPRQRIGVCVWDYASAYHFMQPALEKYGTPDMLQFIKGVPVLATNAGSLWKYMVEWVQHGFSVSRLIGILESSGFSRGDSDVATFYGAIRHIRRSNVPLVNDGFVAGMREMLIRGGAFDDEELEGQGMDDAGTLALGIAERFGGIVSASSPDSQLGAFADCYNLSVRKDTEHDAVAAERILTVLGEAIEAARHPDVTGSLGEMVIAINDTLVGQCIAPSLPDGVRPVVGTMRDLVYMDFDILYITGLSEDGPPGAIFENAILLDEEKQLLHSRTPAARYRVKEEVLQEREEWFDLLKSRARNRLVLSCALKDLATGREKLVSRHMLQEWNRFHQSHDDYKTISKKLALDPRSHNNHVPLQPEVAFHAYELAMGVHLATMENRKSNGSLESDFPFIRTVSAFREARRRARTFDKYWGVVEVPSTKPVQVFSATTLSRWARCPYQYFLRNELRLDRTEEESTEELEWLDPAAYGSFLHELFYRFFIRLRALKGEGFSTVNEDDAVILWEEFDKLLKEYALRYPVVSIVHHDQAVARLHRDATGFFEREKAAISERHFVEVSFGMPVRTDEEYLVRLENPGIVHLNDGTTIRVRGKIDRVDKIPDGRYVLMDYKTGRPYTGDEQQPFNGGELAQAGLYSEVAGQIDDRLTAPLFRYYYTTARGGYQEYIMDYAVLRTHFIGFLTTMIGEIRRGNFVPSSTRADRPPCNFCEFAEVCIGSQWLLAERLQESPELVRYRDIIEHEGES